VCSVQTVFKRLSVLRSALNCQQREGFCFPICVLYCVGCSERDAVLQATSSSAMSCVLQGPVNAGEVLAIGCVGHSLPTQPTGLPPFFLPFHLHALIHCQVTKNCYARL